MKGTTPARPLSRRFVVKLTPELMQRLDAVSRAEMSSASAFARRAIARAVEDASGFHLSPLPSRLKEHRAA